MDQKIYSIFKKGSKTFFTASLFFPKQVKNDVFALYAFVRVADDFVDSIPQQAEQFYAFKNKYLEALKGTSAHDTVIDSFIAIKQKYHFPDEWVEGFLHSMEMDITKHNYETMKELELYLYGSAEVVGLMMCRILGIDEQAYPFAQSLGRAFQYVNFIRDIKEDIELGRRYIPQEELKRYDLTQLSKEYCTQHPEEFSRFIEAQLSTYLKWQKLGEQGYPYIKKRFRIPIKTAADMYAYTAEMIKKNPLIIFERKIKPSSSKILGRVLLNSLLS